MINVSLGLSAAYAQIHVVVSKFFFLGVCFGWERGDGFQLSVYFIPYVCDMYSHAT
jgi:hypothetical protein